MRPIHVSQVSALNHINIILQLLSVVIVHDDIFHQFPHLSCSSLLVLVIFVVWTVYSIGLQYDQSYYSFLVETVRYTVQLSFSGRCSEITRDRVELHMCPNS